MITILACGIGILVIGLLGTLMLNIAKDAGRQEEAMRKVGEDLKIAKRQAEIMAKEKSVEDVANDLDAGTF